MEIALAISISLAAVVWVVFCVWYSLRAAWWRSPIGRNTFGVSAVLAIILARLAIVTWIALNPAAWIPTALGVAIYLAAAAYGIQRTVFMERAQRKQDK